MAERRLEIRTESTTELRDITAQVDQQVEASGVVDRLCFVYCPHTTCGLTINENADPDVRHDLIHALESMVAEDDPAYRHAEGNSAAHVKASLMGFSVMAPVAGGHLALGRWQGIYLCEFDGPRRRQVVVNLTPDAR